MTKIYYGRDLIGRFSCDGKKHGFLYKLGMFIKRTIIVAGGLSALGWAVYFGSAYIPKTVYADRIVEVAKDQDIPILDRIIKCESNNSQFDKNGQVLVHINVQSDGTKSIDVGVGQVNVQVWGATATKMGYNLMDEKDNIAFTKWLFLNKGSVPWISSSACWNK
jgi:hypothetical protein